MSLMPCLGLVSRRELCLIIDGPGTVRLESGEKWRWRCWSVGRLSKYSSQAPPWGELGPC